MPEWLRSKWFPILLILPFIALFILITWPLPAIIFVDPILKALLFIKPYWRSLIFFAVLIAIGVTFFVILLPMLKYALHKIYVYVTLKKICKDYKYKLKVIRFPFASLRGISLKEDLTVTMYNASYAVHFVDLLYPAKSFISISGDKYSINRIRQKGKSSKKTAEFNIPDFSDDTSVKHVFLPLSSKSEVRIVRVNGMQILANGDKFNSMTFYFADGFMRFLKR